MSGERPPVGRSWPPHRYEVGLEKIREYARAVGEQAPHYHERAAAARAGFRSVPAPPVFSAVFCAPAVAAAIFDPDVGVFDPAVGLASYRFVHRSQRFVWSRPVLAGDAITTVARLVAAEDGEDGRGVRVFESTSTDERGEPVLSARYEGVIPPAAGAGKARRAKPAPPAAGRTAGDPSRLRSGDALPDLVLTPDRYAPVRYAGASGDFTPFHLDHEAARAIGLDGVILHGLYSFAQVARAHTAPFSGDPRVLLELSGRFRRPAVPERELRVRTVVTARDDAGRIITGGEARQGDVPVIGEIAGVIDPAAAAASPAA